MIPLKGISVRLGLFTRDVFASFSGSTAVIKCLFTTRNPSCGKVIFSQASIILFIGKETPPPPPEQVSSHPPTGKQTLPIRIIQSYGHASYWNAYLLCIVIRIMQRRWVILPFCLLFTPSYLPQY